VFLSPVVVSVFIALLVLTIGSSYWIQYLSGLIVIAGIVFGVYFAERVRKKHGTENFMSKIYASPDLDDIKKND